MDRRKQVIAFYIGKTQNRVLICRSSSEYQAKIDFSLNTIGDYRFRVATADLTGRTGLAWQRVSLMGKSGQT